MSGFHYLGLKMTILLLIVLVPCILIGGTITLCSFVKEKISEVKDEMKYKTRLKRKRTRENK